MFINTWQSTNIKKMEIKIKGNTADGLKTCFIWISPWGCYSHTSINAGWPLQQLWPYPSYRADSGMKMMYWGSRTQHRGAPWHSPRVWVLLQAGNRLFRSVNTRLCLGNLGLPVAREERCWWWGWWWRWRSVERLSAKTRLLSEVLGGGWVVFQP